MDSTLRVPMEEDACVQIPGESPEWRRPLGPSRSCINIKRGRTTPLLPAATSQHGSTWYASNDMSMTSSSKRSCWKPLGSTWREWEEDHPRTNFSDGSSYINGCVPHWGKDSIIRMKGVLEHDLTWAYYRMSKHSMHPLRLQVGDTLPKTAVVEQMRFGTNNQFRFWSDLRPPFTVLEVKRIDNKIRGTAQVRLPAGFPQKRGPLQILSWGKPVLNWSPKDDEPTKQPVKKSGVPPDQWMPIADELGIRADSSRMAACRELSKKATHKQNSKRYVEVPKLQRLLLGPHASLPRLAECERAQAKLVPPDRGRELADHEGSKAKMRQHRIWTSAAGFIQYAG